MSKRDPESRIFLKKIGKRMRQMRKAKGHSNYEFFAYKCNVSRSNYGKYEKGANLTMETFYKILKGLEVSPEEFFSQGFDNI